MSSRPRSPIRPPAPRTPGPQRRHYWLCARLPDPDLPHQLITVGPVLPSQMLPLRIEQLPIGDMRLTIEVDTHEWRVTGVPDHITVRSAD